jgi:NADPH:quinone reductase-like Zn-dependent oxidoreductase
LFGTVPPLTGSFAEVVRVPADFLYFKPSNVSFTDAAALPLVGLTCLQALTDQQLQSNEHVLVIGASGGTGHVAVQIAKSKGAIVTAICGTSNVNFVRSLGADTILCYNEQGVDVMDKLVEVTAKYGTIKYFSY